MRLILGQDADYSMDPDSTGLNNNVMVVGGPGTGKTYSIYEPYILEMLRDEKHANAAFEISKRRIFRQYAPQFTKKGVKVFDLNYMDPDQANCAYDPMDYIRGEEDIISLSKQIVLADSRKEHSHADPFFDDAACSLMCAEIGLILETTKRPTFADVLELHRQLEISESGYSVETTLDARFENLHRTHPGCFADRCWKTFKEAAIRTARSIFVSLNATIDKVFTTSVCEAMKNKPHIDFRKFAQERSVLFITTSPINSALDVLANMVMGTMIRELCRYAESTRQGRLPIPATLAFDDMACTSVLPDFPKQLANFREYRISSLILLQSESQLEGLYGRSGARTIIDSCDSYVYLGGNSVETAENISRRANIPLYDVLYQSVGNEIIFRRGTKPVFTKRYDIKSDELYKAIVNDDRPGCYGAPVRY